MEGEGKGGEERGRERKERRGGGRREEESCAMILNGEVALLFTSHDSNK